MSLDGIYKILKINHFKYLKKLLKFWTIIIKNGFKINLLKNFKKNNKEKYRDKEKKEWINVKNKNKKNKRINKSYICIKKIKKKKIIKLKRIKKFTESRMNKQNINKY